MEAQAMSANILVGQPSLEELSLKRPGFFPDPLMTLFGSLPFDALNLINIVAFAQVSDHDLTFDTSPLRTEDSYDVGARSTSVPFPNVPFCIQVKRGRLILVERTDEANLFLADRLPLYV